MRNFEILAARIYHPVVVASLILSFMTDLFKTPTFQMMMMMKKVGVVGNQLNKAAMLWQKSGNEDRFISKFWLFLVARKNVVFVLF